MAPASNHLLRTLAAVPVDSRVLDLECGEGEHTLSLLRLGFDVYACDHRHEHVEAVRGRIREEELAGGEVQRVSVAQPYALGYPDAFMDWIVASRLLHGASLEPELADALAEARRVLAPGGWIFVFAPALDSDANLREEDAHYAGDSGPNPSYTPQTLNALLRKAGFEIAEEPRRADGAGEPLLHAIYRRVEEGVAP